MKTQQSAKKLFYKDRVHQVYNEFQKRRQYFSQTQTILNIAKIGSQEDKLWDEDPSESLSLS